MRFLEEDTILRRLEKRATPPLFGWLCARIADVPDADVVSRGLFDQYKWERDVAIEQLEKLGLGFGQKIDGVYLTKEEYEKLLEYKYMYEDLCK